MKLKEKTHTECLLKIPAHREVSNRQQSGTFSLIRSLWNFEICSLFEDGSQRTILKRTMWGSKQAYFIQVLLWLQITKEDSGETLVHSPLGRMQLFENSYMKTTICGIWDISLWRPTDWATWLRHKNGPLTERSPPGTQGWDLGPLETSGKTITDTLPNHPVEVRLWQLSWTTTYL